MPWRRAERRHSPGGLGRVAHTSGGPLRCSFLVETGGVLPISHRRQQDLSLRWLDTRSPSNSTKRTIAARALSVSMTPSPSMLSLQCFTRNIELHFTSRRLKISIAHVADCL